MGAYERRTLCGKRSLYVSLEDKFSNANIILDLRGKIKNFKSVLVSKREGGGSPTGLTKKRVIINSFSFLFGHDDWINLAVFEKKKQT